MAGGMDLGTGGGKGGKKPLDTAINLVPFIDLMAVTISFLIMTAVWTQIGRLQVSQSGPSASADQQDDEKKDPITLTVGEKELHLTVGANDMGVIPVTRDAKNRIDLTVLEEKVKQIKAQQQDQSAVTLQTEDAVRYEDLVRIIDTCIGAGLPNVSVATAG